MTRALGHRTTLQALAAPAAVVLAVLVGWQLATSLGHVDPGILPGPVRVVRSSWDDRANMWPAIKISSEEAVLGVLAAIAVAIVLAIAIDWSRTVRRSVYPLIVASQTQIPQNHRHRLSDRWEVLPVRPTERSG